eukprot:8421657-Heterocapsa_arctica.AAC.1
MQPAGANDPSKWEARPGDKWVKDWKTGNWQPAEGGEDPGAKGEQKEEALQGRGQETQGGQEEQPK